MSVNLSIANLTLQTATDAVTVELDNGDVISAVRVATYQINPKTGASQLIKNTLRYENHLGVRITNVVNVVNSSTRPLTVNRMWFSSTNGAPIYWDNGVFYNADGSVFNGDVTGYQADNNSNTTGPTKTTAIKISRVWIRFSRTQYLQVFRISEYTPSLTGSPTLRRWYFYNDAPFDVPEFLEVLEELPEPVYKLRNQRVTEDTPAESPTDLPISGFSIAWNIMFPTTDDETIGEVIIDDVPYDVSGDTSLNSEAPLGTVVPPSVICTTNVLVHIAYRLRVSPLIMSSPADILVDPFVVTDPVITVTP